MTISENGRKRILTKQRLAIKQLAASAVKGDVRAISKLADLILSLLGPEDEAQQSTKSLSTEDKAILESYLKRNSTVGDHE